MHISDIQVMITVVCKSPRDTKNFITSFESTYSNECTDHLCCGDNCYACVSVKSLSLHADTQLTQTGALYFVLAAMNTQTGMMLSLDEAAALNILDPVQGVYTDLKSKSKMLIGDAVDQKLVEIEYDNTATGMSVQCRYIELCVVYTMEE